SCPGSRTPSSRTGRKARPSGSTCPTARAASRSPGSSGGASARRRRDTSSRGRSARPSSAFLTLRPESNLQSLRRRGREPHRLEIPRDRAVLAVDEGPYRHRARLLEVPAHGLEQPPAQVTAAGGGMAPEAPGPAARFLEPGPPRAQVGEHEPDESPVVLRHLGGAGIAAQAIAHAAFPPLGAV